MELKAAAAIPLVAAAAQAAGRMDSIQLCLQHISSMMFPVLLDPLACFTSQ